ncbi:glycosyltransferase [Aeromonas caviae]|uniref:glycosyltransferase n=1 Tax=Aeromonas caviae TaxID=648 RepID=UPI001CD4C18F|nr:glycosyltransferase [Aeromonas caviae]UBS66985.1 glycosyltransferase [Aeromonas caviae]
MFNDITEESKARVAVIMSVYRSDIYADVEKAIDSILKQTYPCSLYLYQDGPVSAEVSTLLNSICDAHSNVTLMVSTVNCGLAHALNAMIDEIVTKGYNFVARMDSDDFSHPTRIDKQVKYLNQHPDIDILGTSCHEFGSTYALAEKHLPETHSDLVKFSVTRCPFIHPTVMFRTAIFTDGNRYPVSTQLTEDMALWINLILSGYKLANLNDVLLNYRLNENAVKRRMGFRKAWSEFRVRLSYMINSNNVSATNCLLISSRLVFHILPVSFMKFLYKNFR